MDKEIGYVWKRLHLYSCKFQVRKLSNWFINFLEEITYKNLWANIVYMLITDSLHWSLIVICHPGEVAGLKGIFLFDCTMSFGKSTFHSCIFIIFQMKTWTSHPKYHAYCIWILSEEIMQVSKILSKGILKLLWFINLTE